MDHLLTLAGTEFVAPALPEGTNLIVAPPPGRGPGGLRAAIAAALERPIDGPPLADRVGEHGRVLVVFDSPATPTPAMHADPRADALMAIFDALQRKGIALQRISLLCAGGIGRLFRNTEIARVTGVPALASHPVSSHDVEDLDCFTSFGSLPDGAPLELNSALARADLVVSVSVLQTPMHGGWTTLVSGLASARTLRQLYSAENLSGAVSPFLEESPFRRLIDNCGEALRQRVPTFHLELVIDTQLWPHRVRRTIHLEEGAPSRPLLAWNRIPEPLRQRASRLFRAEYQTIGVFAGSTGAAHARALACLHEHAYAHVERQADLLVMGLPDHGPDTAGSFTNPVLSASFAFGTMLRWHCGRPVLRQGGALILLAPLTERFDRRVHLPHATFYEVALARSTSPRRIAEDYEGLYAGRPEYVSAYRRRHGFHGLHPIVSWYLAAGGLAGCGRVFVVGAQPRVAERLGLRPAASFPQALELAREFVGGQPSIAALGTPPVFGVNVGGGSGL